MKPSTLSIVLVVFATFGTACAQFLFKKGTVLLPNLFTNTPFLFGLLIYCLSAVFFILALERGEASVVTPILATNFIWVALLGYFFLGEQFSILKSIGVFIIVAGVSMIGSTRQ